MTPAEVVLDARLDQVEQRLVKIEAQLGTLVVAGKALWPVLAAILAALGIPLIV